jgi:hypothetical protein
MISLVFRQWPESIPILLLAAFVATTVCRLPARAFSEALRQARWLRSGAPSTTVFQ